PDDQERREPPLPSAIAVDRHRHLPPPVSHRRHRQTGTAGSACDAQNTDPPSSMQSLSTVITTSRTYHSGNGSPLVTASLSCVPLIATVPGDDRGSYSFVSGLNPCGSKKIGVMPRSSRLSNSSRVWSSRYQSCTPVWSRP